MDEMTDKDIVISDLKTRVADLQAQIWELRQEAGKVADYRNIGVVLQRDGRAEVTINRLRWAIQDALDVMNDMPELEVYDILTQALYFPDDNGVIIVPEPEKVKRLRDELSQARAWSAAWKRAAKVRRQMVFKKDLEADILLKLLDEATTDHPVTLTMNVIEVAPESTVHTTIGGKGHVARLKRR